MRFRERQQLSQFLSKSEAGSVFGQRVDGTERKVPNGSPKLLLLVSHLSPSGRRVFLSSSQLAESKFVAFVRHLKRCLWLFRDL